MHIHNQNKNVIHEYRKGLYDLNREGLELHLDTFFSENADIHLAFPFEDVAGPKDL